MSLCREVIFSTIYFTAPNSPPTNLQGNNASSTSIFVQWGIVPADNQNGIITNYTVTYQELPSGSTVTKVVVAPRTNTTLKSLHEYTDYSITVFASTSKGGGNESAPIIVITDEDGKFMSTLFYQVTKKNESQTDRSSRFSSLIILMTHFSAPSAPPSAFQGHNTSSTSILVQWGNVPAADQNGIILSYTVTYKAFPYGSPLTKEVSAPTMQATLTGLNEHTNYSITVFATTSKGNGNISASIIVITDEDSKFMRTLVN